MRAQCVAAATWAGATNQPAWTEHVPLHRRPYSRFGVQWRNVVRAGWLLRDAGLGMAVLLVLQRSRDVVWFWVVHFCLDMTQFARITGVG